MKSFPLALRSSIITYSKLDLVAVAMVATTVTAWAGVAEAAFSVRALLTCQATFFVFYCAGSLFASWRAMAAGISFSLPLRLLVGYGVVNTALLVLAWLSPLGIIANFGIASALVLALFFAAAERRRVPADAVSLGVVALCLVAASLWCQDSIQPRATDGNVALFKPWIDGFYHAVHIRIFAESHGGASVEDWRLAGIAARPYHYGMYLLPALIKQASGIASYNAFSGILTPVGVFFTGLAAASLFGSLWGAWPGLTAAAALLLLPDGAQQGMGNTFLSYHWLTQISPSATYGLALLAVAWLFVIQGSSRGSWLQLAAGWIWAAVALVYKLHFVFASGLLLLLVPAIFFHGRLSPKRRALWIIAACLAYGAALIGGQKVPGVPLIRFDGSSVGEILRLVHAFARPGVLRDYVIQHSGAKFPATSNLLFGTPYVLFAAFGVLVPLLVVLVVRLRRRTSVLYVVFPLLLVANFLAMFFGLALDFSSSTPDELSHRPIMIVYFFVVSWLGGAAGLTLMDSRRLARFARPAVVGCATLLMAVPARFGAGVQQQWAMPGMSPVRLPQAALEVADYMKTHGEPGDVFQDSQFDRTYVLAALSERRTFVAHTMTLMPFRADLVEARTVAIDRFLRIRQPDAVRATARAFGFRWFVLERGDPIRWPEEIASHPVLEAGSLKLYEF